MKLHIMRRLGGNLHKAMALPALLLFAVFFLIPLAQGIGISLTDSNGVAKPNFVGLQNFADFFRDDRAKRDIANTVLFAAASAPLLNLFGLAYALLLDRPFPGRNAVRAIVYLPAVISPLIMGYIWYFLLQPGRGFLHQVGERYGIGALQTDWLGSASTTLWVIVLVNVWQYVGMTMIVYLAGLQSIPGEVLEAARIDGAGYWTTLRSITIPLLAPSININVVTNIIGSLSVFDIIVALTDGGPGYSTESLSLYIMRMLYGSFTGYSTAVAILLFLIILVPVSVYLMLMRRRQIEA
jgi:raffinose/stachyose/melibiose transport system permease protein